jgi:tryptophan synthase alpha chain
MKRIEKKFSELKSKNQTAFIAYICAGHPDYETSLKVLKSMPDSGVDVIELGVPFLDPAGDGPIIENAAKRAVQGGMTLRKTLEMAQEFRKNNEETPLILMSYYNPILKYGLNKIFSDAAKSGVDGFLIVDLPLEEEKEILSEIKKSKLDLIQLIAPTTNPKRAKEISKNAGGFLYLVSMLGITGTKSADISENKKNLQNLRKVSNLPIAIGFGIKTPEMAQEFSRIGADGIVIGSAIVKEIDENFSEVTKKISDFSNKIKN